MGKADAIFRKKTNVQQQKALIQQKSLKTPNKEDGQNKNKPKLHVAGSNVSFCGEGDYVAIIGPNNMKIIQYFSCRTVIEMMQKHPFAELQ